MKSLPFVKWRPDYLIRHRRGRALLDDSGDSHYRILMQKLVYSYALRSFLGHLEGTQKSLHTIESYRSDLNTFSTFLNEKLSSKAVALSKLTREDLLRYDEYLKATGLKTNTRRRKLLTVRRFFRYLKRRKKIDIDIGERLPAPYKLEKVPYTVKAEEFLPKLQAQSQADGQTILSSRNSLLMNTLFETGCSVSELCLIRFEDFKFGESPMLAIRGKLGRDVPISAELAAGIQKFMKDRAASAKSALESDSVFLGYNKFGPLGGSISPRGVELLVKAYSQRLKLPLLTPRVLRHSAVLNWFRNGIDRKEIQRRLGLKTNYSFKIYEPIFEKLENTESVSS